MRSFVARIKIKASVCKLNTESIKYDEDTD